MKRSGIRLLTNFAPQDFVTEVLRSVTLKTVVFGRAELRAVFHIVLRGEGWLKVNTDKHVRLNCGDIILFPRADAHDMNDHPATAIRPLQELLVQHPMTADRRFCYGGPGSLTTMLCGAFQLDDPKLNLLGLLLPPLLHIKS